MPRKPRIHFPGAIYHSILRGNNRRNIFFSNEDRLQFYSLLEEGISRFRYHIHAFCLMTNHVHLLIEISDITLSKIMQNLSFRYAQWINKKLNQIGHLFQGRYKAILVQNQDYLVHLCRYIHLNPLKAKLVQNLADYPWSSHQTYLGKEELNWVTTQEILSLIQQLPNHLSTYQKFIEDTSQNWDKEPIFSTTLDEEFIITDKVILKYQSSQQPRQCSLPLECVIEIVSETLKIEKFKILSASMQHNITKARALVAIFGQRYSNVSLQELAILFNRDASTISHGIYNHQIRCQHNEKDSDILREIQEKIKKVAKLQV